MKDKDIYKALRLVQKGEMKKRQLALVCQKLTAMDLIRLKEENVEHKTYELSIKGKVFIWDWENWKL
jgi:predicted transcriptional regulator